MHDTVFGVFFHGSEGELKQSDRRSASDVLEALRRLHDAVDAEAGVLSAQHVDRLQCRRGCFSCCVDGLSVFAVEAALIQREAAALLSEGAPHARGGCAFLDGDGACRIYAHRPYVCRTQGLPLRWFSEVRGEAVEYRDICSLNEGGAPIERLPAGACWTIGPWEARLAELQGCWADGRLDRVSLRSLFPGPTADRPEAER